MAERLFIEEVVRVGGPHTGRGFEGIWTFDIAARNWEGLHYQIHQKGEQDARIVPGAWVAFTCPVSGSILFPEHVDVVSEAKARELIAASKVES